MSASLTVTARFEPGREKTFQHIPFTVPDDVRQLHLSITYNDQIGSSPMLSGGNTLDIGVFDAQGTEAGGPGLRGWSGSNKTEITIGADWATPPYRAAAIQPGTWHILLGAYKVGPNGLDATCTVTFDDDRTAPELPEWPDRESLQRASLPPAAEPNWYRGDLHMHTVYSDGDSYPHELAARAWEIGLDFYGITDHNRAQSPAGLVPESDGWPVLVPGVEVTTYAGHFNVWGTDRWYDFRDYSAAGLRRAVDQAIADGGLVSLNHPKPFGPMWEHLEVTGFHAIEPWNGWWGGLNNLAVGYWADFLAADSMDRWHVGVCGSDMHMLKRPGNPLIPVSEATMGWPTLWIHTDEPLSPASILTAIRRGECFISESPAGPQVYLWKSEDGVLTRIVGAKGDIAAFVGPEGTLAASAITKADATIPVDYLELGDAGFVRIEVHAAGGGIRALSNPLWLRED